jgi:hypothetical protein
MHCSSPNGLRNLNDILLATVHIPHAFKGECRKCEWWDIVEQLNSGTWWGVGQRLACVFGFNVTESCI